MDIGLFTNCFINYPLDKACEHIKNLGVRFIEIPTGGYLKKNHCGPARLLKYKDDLSTFMKTIKKYKFEISALTCHGNPLDPRKSIADKHIFDLEKTIEFASRIGVMVVTVLSGCPGAGENALYPNWINYYSPEVLKIIKWQWQKKVIPFWGNMAKKAKKAGVKIGFEMHPGNVVYNTEDLLKLRESVGYEEISCNFDPSHLFWQGIDPIVSINKLGSAIVHVHAKDSKINKLVSTFRGVNDWKDFKEINKRAWIFRTIGFGNNEEFWRNFVSTLRMNGYDDVLSIEFEDPLLSVKEGLQKSIEFLERVLIREKIDDSPWSY